ncbi:hypothetical protein E4U55_003411 [Claviceps digitariae]|nr:hypothetical protein E4U55_003411 [Claviceps digitariae]
MHYNTSKLRDAIPLDQSDEFKAFLLACRLGDLAKCQECISQGVNINGRDSFDYTPLIIAERNTFQGERCIYNALNNRIRNLLLQYDFSKTSDPLVYWSSHISSLLTRTTPRTSDITLMSGSRSFPLHKFLLASRTQLFRETLRTQPGMSSWKFDGTVPVEAIHIALRHMYLDDSPGDVGSSSLGGSGLEKRGGEDGGKEKEKEEEVEVDGEVLEGKEEKSIWKGLNEISKQLGLEHGWDASTARNRRLARQRFLDEEERALQQLREFFQSKILGNKMVVDVDHVRDVKWRYGENAAFADVLLRADDQAEAYNDDDEDDNNDNGSIRHTTNKHPSRAQRHATLYPVHKAMLLRSKYFETMFSGDFLESHPTEHLRIITVDVSPPVLELVLTYLYVENPIIPLPHALDLLYAADMLFLDALKTKAAQAISTLGNQISSPSSSATSSNNPLHDKHPPPIVIEPINIYDIVHAAWDLRVPRLEQFAARYLAARLEHYIHEPDFHDLIAQSARRIRHREETDSIELLDDIRHYLSERFRLRFPDTQLHRMMMVEEEEEGEEEEGEEEQARTETGVRDVDTRTGSCGKGGGAGDGGVGKQTPRGEEDETVEGDAFASDAINHQLLLDEIDAMLETLKLSA